MANAVKRSAKKLDTPHILKKMLLDVIFLDIDGVLNPDKDKHPHVFDPECVRQLRRILDASPQVHVVMSTSWRTGFPFFVLGWLWHQHDLPIQRVIGRTPDIQNDRRGEEIQKWLADAPLRTKEHQVRRYAALDDEPEPILEVISRQHVFPCDPWHGLTSDVADRVIRHFAAPAAVIKSLKHQKTA
jgi:hypothetical protein